MLCLNNVRLKKEYRNLNTTQQISEMFKKQDKLIMLACDSVTGQGSTCQNEQEVLPDLHVIVAHTVHQEAFQMECRRKACKLQKACNLNCLVDLRDLSDESHKCHVLKCRYILLER